MKFTVVGGGAMGTACAFLLANRPEYKVTLWCRDALLASELAESQCNRRYLATARLPDSLKITADFASAADADAFVLAVPVVYLRETLSRLRQDWPRDSFVIGLVKGVERGTFKRPSEIVSEMLASDRYTVLTGPSHAEEIVSPKQATSVVAVANEIGDARKVCEWFHQPRFRLYATTDLKSAELAGALKNVMAIAAGISDGLGFGSNAKSALLTRGLREMNQFGVDHASLMGLAGVGDLMTTCFSSNGRNLQFGQWVGKGHSFDDAMKKMHPKVVEGVWTTRALIDSKQFDRDETPITSAVYSVLFESVAPEDAVEALLARTQKEE